MDLTARLRGWTRRRQCLGDPGGDAEGALRAVVAVYSAHPTAPLALHARAAGMSPATFRALEQRRAALRIPAMRGSLFLVPAATAGRLFAPFTLSSTQLATRLRRGGLTDVEYAAVADRVVAAATEPLLPRQLHGVAGVSGLEMSILLRTLRGEGRLLAVSDGTLRVATLRYVATDAWAPGSLTVPEIRAAVEQLAGDYLHGYGPARVADFAWWTGLGKGVAAAAIAAHDTVDVGDGLRLPAADEAAFGSVTPLRESIDLLPKWDPYTMGYAPDGRARLVHPDNQPRLYVRKGVVAPGQPNVGLPGDGYPAVLVDGEAVGTWSLTLKGPTLNLFDRPGALVRKRVDQRLAAAADFLAG